MIVDLMRDAVAGTVDGIAVGVAFLLALAFTVALGIVLFEDECGSCGHSNYQHDEDGCTGKDALPGYSIGCKCHGFRGGK